MAEKTILVGADAQIDVAVDATEVTPIEAPIAKAAMNTAMMT